MTIKDVLLQGKKILSETREAASLEAELLLGFAMGMRREELFMYPEKEVDDVVVKRFLDSVEKVKNGFPVAYITHEKGFYGLSFYVDERVLISRPETEMLVEKGLELISLIKKVDQSKEIVVADVGSGSGCIGLSLLKNVSDLRLLSLDISKAALEVAKMNAKNLQVENRVEFLESDLLNTILDQRVDLIVANLPYIGTKTHDFVDEDVKKFEPNLALFAGEDGLLLYKKMFQQISKMKHKPRYIIGEFGFGQAESLKQKLNTYFDQSFEIFQDFAGIDRMFVVTL